VTHRILVPFELPDSEPVSPVLVEDLASMDIVALGHFNLPEQTPADAGKAQFQEEARAELDDLAAPFREAGASVTTRLVFGKNRAKTIDRVAIEEDCDAELDPAPTERIDRILVPIVDTENVARMSDFIAVLCEDATTEITLFHVIEDGSDETVGAIEDMLGEAREALLARGYDPGLVDVLSVSAGDHDDAILERAEEYDAVVMGEAHPGGVRERIFGTLPDRIATRTGDPVIVVRRNI
jgi:nucleotide-binding universal stress UspA family protein